MTKFAYGYIIGIVIGIILLITSNNTIVAQNQNSTTTGQNQSNTTTTTTGQNQFNPVPLNEIPLVVINHTNGQYKFGADFSLDFGDLPVIEHDISSSSVPTMQLDKDILT